MIRVRLINIRETLRSLLHQKEILTPGVAKELRWLLHETNKAIRENPARPVRGTRTKKDESKG